MESYQFLVDIPKIRLMFAPQTHHQAREVACARVQQFIF